MKDINPVKTKSWKKLEQDYEIIKNIHMKEMFLNEKDRFKDFSVNFNDEILIDYSKNRINRRVFKNLIGLAKETCLKDAINSMFNGEKINVTENREVSHTYLRGNISNIDYAKNIFLRRIRKEIDESLSNMENFSENIINGLWKGYTGKRITDIVNVGIGGSNLGPKMMVHALESYRNHLRIHFLSSIDQENFNNLLKIIHPETTLFLISSKTFRTQETLMNAYALKKWFLKKTNNQGNIENHFIAITMNVGEAKIFGLNSRNIFKIWSWVGGRYSVWSAIGLSVVLSIGFSNFKKILIGANSMDHHFYNNDFERNIPIIMALIEIWYSNFFKFETVAILPYNYCLRTLPSYLQQLGMESNGKNVDRNHQKISYKSSPIVWGSSGIDGQHAFYQLLHQGTNVVPCDFIGSVRGFERDLLNNVAKNHHDNLMSNFFAQSEILAFGNIKREKINEQLTSSVHTHKFLFGNRPSNSILIKKITPYTMGALVSMYEHKVFSQGVILNIFSFDQWGVESGKKLANHIFSEIVSPSNKQIKFHDHSTNGLINLYKNWKS
ncbi:glucose-6-phosphate isomerase [Candidatus Riesia pediculischaeffi]|uniref:Glucose-6-phosphate isomerase n=2 Tax=Candidatus Riesia pediculischaeffi TaxID=428411 RepID=A0A1V0HK10_9ENTR|nr:glucose-6-phosphate isomerase [Candidatus Riesia pediculischaeffi]ARC53160.1 glucose-6-phosphate isomerase [Candidatus Riesia pediculischaeffi]KIE64211.1 Glucose-6-phosphate isomerase [Candidatus Riesia pediculischaeffi PTSU]